MKASVAKVFSAIWQRYRIHFMRNVLAHAGKSGRWYVSAILLRKGRGGAQRTGNVLGDSARLPIATSRHRGCANQASAATHIR